MFDEHACSLFTDFPEFEGLTRDDVARALSAAYLSVIGYKVNGSDEHTAALEDAQPYLRRLANTLMFHVVLVESRESAERRAAAFVAAEAIALMADYLAVHEAEEEDQVGVRSTERFVRVEAALLYLLAGYDACSGGVLLIETPTLGVDASTLDTAADWCFRRLEQLCRLRLHQDPEAAPPFGESASEELSAGALEEDTIARLYREIGQAVLDFLTWLTESGDGLENATARLDRVIEVLSPGSDADDGDHPPLGYEFGRIFHLCTLLSLCLPALGERSVVDIVPIPPSTDAEKYRQYIRGRALGEVGFPSRPVLWPSAYAYVRRCLVGDAKHAVVSMPTGSGKSFIGELAVSQAVSDGWALYLAPTNALTEQIRGDLREGLRDLDTDILAFVGDHEYSIFTEERVDEMLANSVAVMTPEKCALALRLSPSAFENCRLVVFDECHLLGDTGSSRGPVAELILTQLMLRAPTSRFLLMSAIVQNPDELAEWIATATGAVGTAVTIGWRPTRTLRAVLGVDDQNFQEAAKEARKALKELPDRRKKVRFSADCAIAASLQGAWQTQAEPDYAITRLDCRASLSVHRKKTGAKWRYTFNADSWVNDTATSLATKLVERDIQTLVFTPASKHYPFSNARKVALADDTLQGRPGTPSRVNFCEILTEYELGCTSEVFELLRRGVAVHTSLMLETEKIGSELMFRKRTAPLMFATGTLAQGLNLPAVAVVIAGSRIGDPRGQERSVVDRRKFSQLLNAAGRAGRAGFANQGLVVAIPDAPVSLANFSSVLKVRDQVDYLQKSDDSVRVESGLEGFLDSVCDQTLRSDQANDTELQVVSILAGGDANQLAPQSVLSRTFAAYLRRKAGGSEVNDEDAEHLIRVGTQFVEETGAPAWLTIAAQRAGLDFFLTFTISRAWESVRAGPTPDYQSWSVQDWVDELIRLIPHIPPGLLARHLTRGRLKQISETFKAIDKNQAHLFYTRELEWTPPDYWLDAWQTAVPPLRAWMEGASIREIASLITGKGIDEIPWDRIQGKAIPRALSVTGESWSALALIAGGFLAVAEQVFEGEVPLALACLPMSIKYGCDSPGALAWFRFGIRLRRPSRLLAERYPPPHLPNDEELKEWVRTARRDWLQADFPDHEDPDGPVLASIEGFLTQ